MDVGLPYRAHDLLRIDPAALSHGVAPAWVAAALARAPWVVVRRAPATAGRVPVGVRGQSRSERHGDWLDVAAVSERLSPEALLTPERLRRTAGRLRIPAIALAHALVPLFSRLDLAWGPTGSVGFELATGVPTAHDNSDLDLIVRCDERLARTRAAVLLGALRSGSAACGGCRFDAVLETPRGGVSLAEYVDAAGPVLLRSVTGPRLVADPWSTVATRGGGQA